MDITFKGKLNVPHIRIRSVSEKNVQALSKKLPKDLAKAMETTEDNFSFELISTKYFSNGKAKKSYPYIEVHWFERTQEIKQRSANIITDLVRSLTKAEDIAVVFTPIQKSDYFENGKSF